MSAASGTKGTPTALRGTLVWCADDPFLAGATKAFRHEPDGLVIVHDGKIVAAGGYDALKTFLPADAVVTEYRDCLITPGFVDTHIHFVQTGIMGAQGRQLLDWLDRYTYPAEEAFADEKIARATARVFCDELLRNGTTTALVFCSVHPQSVDALFEEASQRGLLIIAGKVLMDRNAPAALLDTAQTGYDQSKALIGKWHGKGRLRYAVTPRFAGTSTPEQLKLAGTLRAEHPDLHMQTHIAESEREVAWIRELFPERLDYFDTYAHFGLTGRRAVLAHGVHLDEVELCRCHESGTAIAHCPTSNTFLGSGLFRVRNARDAERPVEVGLGTDIGAGTSFSLLATMGEAYKVSQLAHEPINAVEAFYLATLGGARALDLDKQIGSLAPGRDADLVVLDPAATPLMAFRSRRAQSVKELLAVLMTLGDDRAIKATYTAGKLAHERAPSAAG
jgi:guanine deaminase